MRWYLRAVWLCVFASVGSTAHATPDDPAKRRAAATALFEQGIAALQAGRTAEACDKLAESVATMPDSGAKGALAECNTELGRFVEAWQLWRELATAAPTAELRDDAARNAAELDKKLARVALHVSGVATHGLAITLNDKPVTASDTSEHRVMPGRLVVVAESPEIERWTKTYQAKAGEKLEVEVRTEISHSAVQHRRRGRIAGITIAAAGLVTVGIGAVYGRAAFADWDRAGKACGDLDRCARAGYDDAQQAVTSARRSATISSWTMSAGAVVAATGVFLYVLYREPTYRDATAWRAAPMADAQTVGLTLSRSLP